MNFTQQMQLAKNFFLQPKETGLLEYRLDCDCQAALVSAF
jgi:hypothetical protein